MKLTERTKRRIWQTVDVDVEVDARPVRIRRSGHVASDGGLGGVGQHGGVGDADGVVVYDGGIT